jgi:Protein of unknown function (DUF1571)
MGRRGVGLLRIILLRPRANCALKPTLIAGWAIAVALSGCRAGGTRTLGATLLEQTTGIDSAGVARSSGIDTALAHRNPLAFLRACIDHYDRSITDYRCTFLVCERLHGSLGPEQEMAVLFRESPFSVDVTWQHGSMLADRVSYVAGRWTRGGKQLAYVRPHGVLGLLMPAGVKRDIHAPDVLAASRRPIDQFGFRSTLRLFVYYCERAAADPQFHLAFVGLERFDGYPCFVFERLLPFSDRALPGVKQERAFPDRLQRMYIDAKWLVPRACFAYADDAGETLIGSYVARDIEFNVGLTDSDFATSATHRD